MRTLTLPVHAGPAELPPTRIVPVKKQDSLALLVELLETVQQKVGEAVYQADAAGLDAHRQASLAEGMRKRLEGELEIANARIAELEKLERIPHWVRKMFHAL